jgi:hypothetical protein
MRSLGYPTKNNLMGTPLPEEMRSLGYPTKNNLRGTPLPEEMRSLGYPAKNILRGTIAILKGNLAESQVPFSRIFGPSG